MTTSATAGENRLGIFLKDRRARVDPAALGITPARRRTPGLRREEVAQRANVSATWYTWLEQGRGGGPSAELLARVANALMLTAAEREHLFLLAQRRPPDVRYQPPEGVTPQLQRLLDSLEFSPALVKTAAWDIVAWNRAAAVVLLDYATIAPEERNILRLVFGSAHVRATVPDWEREARFAVARFRLEAARAGACETATALVDDLCRSSPDFAAIWRDNDVSTYGEGTKHIVHAVVGPLALEYSSLAVDGQPNLGVVIYTPATCADMERIRSLVAP